MNHEKKSNNVELSEREASTMAKLREDMQLKLEKE